MATIRMTKLTVLSAAAGATLAGLLTRASKGGGGSQEKGAASLGVGDHGAREASLHNPTNFRWFRAVGPGHRGDDERVRLPAVP
jgi:hypothetical protein